MFTPYDREQQSREIARSHNLREWPSAPANDWPYADAYLTPHEPDDIGEAWLGAEGQAIVRGERLA
jgi:hypothetical protein